MLPDKVQLCCLPTPLHKLEMLSDDPALDLWIKRDDLTGFAGGGNKGRKLEYLMAEALSVGATAIVTNGSLQSNFVRQLGAACARYGIACAAAVMHAPFDAEFGPPQGPKLRADNGNVLLDELLGVDLRVCEDAPWEDLWAQAELLAQEYERRGYIVYRVPVGGSSPLGAYAFLKAAEEIDQRFDAVVVCCSSGSTHAGLAYAFHGTPTRVLGIAADPEEELFDDLVRLTAGLDLITGEGKRLRREDFDLRFDWVGPGYGVITDEGMDAIRTMARQEGVFLDPVYSAKAFAGLQALVAKGELGGRVLFWHTGGVPSLAALP